MNFLLDMLSSPVVSFKHEEFNSIDAEDSVYQLCMLMDKLDADFIPVIDPGILFNYLFIYLDLISQYQNLICAI